MLQNNWILQKSHFLIKNNLYLTNVFVYKMSLFFWKNINLYTITLLEKYLLEYWVKNLYKTLVNYSNIYIVLCIEITCLVVIYSSI